LLTAPFAGIPLRQSTLASAANNGNPRQPDKSGGSFCARLPIYSPLVVSQLSGSSPRARSKDGYVKSSGIQSLNSDEEKRTSSHSISTLLNSNTTAECVSRERPSIQDVLRLAGLHNGGMSDNIKSRTKILQPPHNDLNSSGNARDSGQSGHERQQSAKNRSAVMEQAYRRNMTCMELHGQSQNLKLRPALADKGTVLSGRDVGKAVQPAAVLQSSLLQLTCLPQKEPAAESWVQCDRCNKWRSLPHNAKVGLQVCVLLSISQTILQLEDVKNKEWYCSMNEWDLSRQSCSAPQEEWVQPVLEGAVP
jgi:hypothetical protein